MSLPKEKLELCCYVDVMIQSRHIDRRNVSGYISDVGDFDEIVNALDEVGSLVEKDESKRTITFKLPAGYYNNMAEFIQTPGNSVSIPEKFYIAEINYLYRPDVKNIPVPVVIDSYIKLCKLFTFLGDVSDYDYNNGISKILVLIGKAKLEITSEYTAADLVSFKLISDFEQFEKEFWTTEIHQEQKKAIIKAVIIDMFNSEGRIPFSVIINNIEDICSKIKESYQLYMSEFSFQKIKSEVEKEKLDATLKLNKVFSDIQNQLLAVPAALILAGGQFENVQHWSSKNTLIWLGVLFFSIFMTMLIRNQRHTLNAVDLEIKLQWDNINGKHYAIADKFKSTYQELKGRFRQQHKLLSIVSALVSLSLLITTGLFIYYSQSMRITLISLSIGGVAAICCKMGSVVFTKFFAKKKSDM